VIGVSGFTHENHVAKSSKVRSSTNMHYKASSLTWSAITNTGNWEIATGSEDCPGGNATTCIFPADQSSVSDFVNYLTTTYSSNHTDAVLYIRDNALSYKN
jgi:hypothetical protein